MCAWELCRIFHCGRTVVHKTIERFQRFDKMESAADQCTNQMDELRHVQLLLKREDIFIDFQAHEIQELNLSLRQESQRVLYLQKFLLFLHMNSMGEKALGLTPTFFDSLFSEIQAKVTQTPPSAPNQIAMYNRVISTFVETTSLLASACIDLAKNNPEILDQMAFSTIPGLFGYLWSAESAQKFIGFMGELIKQGAEYAGIFTRVIFAVPQFRQFFDAVMAELVNKVATVSNKDEADAFCDEFIAKWADNAQFCPNVVKNVLSMAADPAVLLVDSFIKPAFESPRTFGIIPLSLRLGREPTDLISEALISKATQMWEHLAKVETPTTLPSAEKLSKILPDLGKSALFTADDLAVLGALVESANKINSEFPVKPSQLEGNTIKGVDYQTYSFTLPTVQDVQRSSSSEPVSPEDEIEKQLREMLTGVDVIPLAAQSGSPDMVELLKSQVQLARPDHRLLLEMKIDDFESARRNAGNNMTFKDFLDLLKRKFEERQPQRLDKLSKISLYNTEYSQMGQLSKSLKTSIDMYRDVLKFHLVEKWLKEAEPLKEITDQLSSNSAKFGEFFFGIIEKWQQWCKAQQYQVPASHEILHNIVMTEIPQDRFLKMNQDLSEKDVNCYEGITGKRDDLLRQNAFDFTSIFQENPKLLDAAQRQLQQAFDAPLPLVKLNYFCEALNTLVFVLTFEGHKEVGADQWLPMTILLLVLSAPKRLPSTIAYIDHFVKSLMEDMTHEIRLISEQTEYTFTMVKSALLHFEKSIPGIGNSEQ